MESKTPRRRVHVGAEPVPGGGVHFRVWAPRRRRVAVALENVPGASLVELTAEGEGYFSGLIAAARVGTLYRFRLDDDPQGYPDPASRFQPEGPHGPSCVIDPGGYAWSDGAWKGCKIRGRVVYELHVGTFTPEGSWAAAERELPELAAAGIDLLELMPVAEFPGRFGWGYDGVDLYAPTRLYGTPDEFRRFVDRAHALGIGVILDVVYNHVGPDGNYLKQFAPSYFTDRYSNEWGEALNFDGPDAAPVREFFIANAGYWIDEFHLDGLRLDATQSVHDASREHVLAAITARVRRDARGRDTVVIAENEPQHTRLVRAPSRGGYGMDALWNDDLHHSAVVAVTGRNEAYYADHAGAPQEFVSAAKWGYLFQGQYYAWQKQRRGTPGLDLSPEAFVNCVQNHDQVANSARGRRLHQLTSPGRYRALTAYLLLAPGTPMLFQGQEFCASSPFLYFADHDAELSRLVAKGRGDFLTQFPSIADPTVRSTLAAPNDPETFARSKLDLSERTTHAAAYALHKDLIRLRRSDPAFSAQRRRGLDGAVLGPECFVLRFFGDETPGEGAGMSDRLLLVNFGTDLRLERAPEPLLAPPLDARWSTLWSSEDVRYDGQGTAAIDPDADVVRIPGHAAFVLAPRASHPSPSPRQEAPT